VNTKYYFANLIEEFVNTLHADLIKEAKQSTSNWQETVCDLSPAAMKHNLEIKFQKVEIRYDEVCTSYSAMLWYDGKGMLPPNIELYRIPTEADAIRALYTAALLAFPEETDDDSE